VTLERISTLKTIFCPVPGDSPRKVSLAKGIATSKVSFAKGIATRKSGRRGEERREKRREQQRSTHLAGNGTYRSFHSNKGG